MPYESRAATLTGGLLPKSIETRLVSGKKFTMSIKRGSTSVKQETCFNKAAISSQLGVREGTKVPFSSVPSQVGTEPVVALPHSEQTSFPIEGPKDGTLLGPTMLAGGMGVVGASEIGSTWDLLAGSGTTAMDLKKRLCYFSLNSACRFATMSYSSPSG